MPKDVNFGIDMTRFSWPTYPKTDAEFEGLLTAIDSALAAEGVKPFQRPIHVGRKLWEAFQWEGLLCPAKELAEATGFSGDVLMAKAHQWYEQTYGDQLKSDWAHGFVPVKLGNSVWRLRAAVMFGRVQLFIDKNLQNRGVPVGLRGAAASSNVLCQVEGLPQGLADRLSNQALEEFFRFHLFALQNLQWRDQLPTAELLGMARADFDQCTGDVLAHRYGQARWAAQQAVEKTLKGLLSIAGTPFSTNGPNGHNLQSLAQLLETKHGVEITPSLLALASCSAKVRYGEEPSDEIQALSANHAVLGVLEQLRTSPKVSSLLASGEKATA